jgi:hypothetical protein
MKNPASSSKSKLHRKTKTKARPRAGLSPSAHSSPDAMESLLRAWFVPPLVMPLLLAIAVIAAGLLH